MGRRQTKWSGGDRCRSGGFLLRIMPPSWHPVPACTRNGHSEDGQFINAATTAAGGPFNTATTIFRRRNYSSLRQRKLESDASSLRQKLLQAGYSSLRQRKFESDTASLRLQLLQASLSSLRQRKLESDAAPLRQRLRRRAILLAGTIALHRFSISSPDLRIDAAKRSKQGQSVHRF